MLQSTIKMRNRSSAKGRKSVRGPCQTPESNEVTIRLHIEALEEGGYVATSPDVPGLVAEGRSVMEAVEIAQGLTRKIVESCLEHNDPLPPALATLNGTKRDLLVPVGIR
jgi:predicted RNase H-like HicB family nuclease